MSLQSDLNDYTIDKPEVYEEWISKGVLDTTVLEEVIQLATGGTERERKRANWILHHISDRNPKLFEPRLKQMIHHLPKAITDAEVRFVLRYFSMYQLPVDEELEGSLLNYSLKCVTDPKQAVAPRVYGMTIAYRMVERYPELATELEQTIELALENGSAAMKNRAEKILKSLRKKGLL
jgi:hypothetical protein